MKPCFVPLLAVLLPTAGWLGAAEPDAKGVAPRLALIPEMEQFPELAWPRSASPELPPALRPAIEKWRKSSPDLDTIVTAEAVRSLSRWARAEMERYEAVPPLAQVKLAVVKEDTPHDRVLLEGTLDTLPAHSPIVTRWLKVFLVCDTGNWSVVRTVVTIRGQVLE
jgi:hypothetical protein